MDRLFLRVYLNVFVGVVLAAAAALLLVLPRIGAQIDRNIESISSASVALVAELIAERHRAHGDFGGDAQRALERLAVPHALLAQSALSLPAEAQARLDRGEVVRRGSLFDAAYLAPIVGTNRVLEVGPLALVRPLGGGRGILLLLLLVAGLSLGVFVLLGRMRRQLAELRRTAEALGRGELAARAPVTSRDAIGAVASTMNRMADDLQRLIAVREELLHVTSHELRTPIQRMHFALESARDAAADDAREVAFDRLDRDLGELDRLIEELLTYVRLKERRAPVKVPVDVGPVIGELCETLTELATRVELVARVPAAQDLPVHGEARLIRRAASNLIVNALRHARSRVEVTATREAGQVLIHVDDDGPGIPVESRERVFVPFERLEDAETGESRGFGLGLAIVRRIAETYGGSVAALDSELGGARFRLSLPA